LCARHRLWIRIGIGLPWSAIAPVSIAILKAQLLTFDEAFELLQPVFLRSCMAD